MPAHFLYKTAILFVVASKLCHSYESQGFFVAHAKRRA
jgi:hypothetical protein